MFCQRRRFAVDVGTSAAGGLLLWGYNYANNTVHNQLAAQSISFPTKAAFAQAKPGTEITPGMIPYLSKYAGQELTTGAQAEAYADHFIAVHLQEIGGSKTYSELSAAAMALPKAGPPPLIAQSLLAQSLIDPVPHREGFPAPRRPGPGAQAGHLSRGLGASPPCGPQLGLGRITVVITMFFDPKASICPTIKGSAAQEHHDGDRQRCNVASLLELRPTAGKRRNPASWRLGPPHGLLSQGGPAAPAGLWRLGRGPRGHRRPLVRRIGSGRSGSLTGGTVAVSGRC